MIVICFLVDEWIRNYAVISIYNFLKVAFMGNNSNRNYWLKITIGLVTGKKFGQLEMPCRVIMLSNLEQ